VTRSGLVFALLLASAATAQPATYFVPIVQRTPTTTPIPGAAPLQVSLVLPAPGVPASSSFLFGAATQAPVPYALPDLTAGGVANLQSTADAIVAAPGVLVAGASQTLLAVSSGGIVSFGTLESTGFVSRGPGVTIPGTRQLALAAVPDGGAALLVSNGSQVTRWDLDVSSGKVQASPGFTGSAAPLSGGDVSLSLVLDGFHDIGFIGGQTLGDIYVFDARLDAGPPQAFDLRLLSAGRLTAPVTGLALYGVEVPLYLLAANGAGLTVYPLPGRLPVSLMSIGQTDLDAGFRVIAVDPSGATGPITGPQGVALTNLPAGSAYPDGMVVLGDPATRGLATLSWSALADGGLLIDPTDPRGTPAPDAGLCPDGGVPDGGSCAPPPSGGPGNLPGPPGPYVPPPASSSSCASAPGGPALAVLLLGLVLLVPRRRQRP